MNINEIDTAADMIIRAYSITANTPLDSIRDTIDTYCDDPDIDRITKMRIRVRIEQKITRPIY